MKDLSEIKRIKLGILPTPLHRLENISNILKTNIYIKRDDLIGMGLGGNKVRKLEFLLADAKEKGAEIVFTTGQAQSNHAMLTAACALKLGMTPILILKKRGNIQRKGNQFLEYLMGVEVHLMDTDSYEDIYKEMDRMGQQLGKKYYKIPCGGSNEIGALGYIQCVKEISEQASNIKFNHIICAEGSGGTHAGIALGAKIFMKDTKVTGVKVDTDPFEKITPNIMRGAMKLLNCQFDIKDEDVFHYDMCGDGYGIPSKEGNEAIKLMARNEGIFLDPVYTGKTFAGIIKMAKEGYFKKDDNVLFVFSGGAGGLFALDENLD